MFVFILGSVGGGAGKRMGWMLTSFEGIWGRLQEKYKLNLRG